MFKSLRKKKDSVSPYQLKTYGVSSQFSLGIPHEIASGIPPEILLRFLEDLPKHFFRIYMAIPCFFFIKNYTCILLEIDHRVY